MAALTRTRTAGMRMTATLTIPCWHVRDIASDTDSRRRGEGHALRHARHRDAPDHCQWRVGSRVEIRVGCTGSSGGAGAMPACVTGAVRAEFRVRLGVDEGGPLAARPLPQWMGNNMTQQLLISLGSGESPNLTTRGRIQNWTTRWPDSSVRVRVGIGN